MYSGQAADQSSSKGIWPSSAMACCSPRANRPRDDAPKSILYVECKRLRNQSRSQCEACKLSDEDQCALRKKKDGETEGEAESCRDEVEVEEGQVKLPP